MEETPTLSRSKSLRKLPYHFMFVKVFLLFIIALYMALRGFLSYMFIKQRVGTNVEDMSGEFMSNFLSLLSVLFFVAEFTLFFGFIAVSKEHVTMTTLFAVLMTLQIMANLLLGEPTAVLFSTLIAAFTWWFCAMLRKIDEMKKSGLDNSV